MAKHVKSPMGILVMVALLIVAGFATKLLAVNPGSFFELEGDIHDSPAGGPNDWENNLCPSIDASTALVNTGVVDDPHPLSIFTQGGSKDKLDVSQWAWKDGSVPDKDDIVNAFAATYAGPSTTLLYVGGTRFSNDGSAEIGAWFFQNSVGLTGDGSTAAPFTGVHKNGDLFVLAEFTIGGSVSTLRVLEWVGSPGSCPSGPCPAATEKGDTLADVTASAVSSFGFSNSTEQVISCPGDWPYTPKSGPDGTIPVNSFFEVGIDLGELGLSNVCFASFLVETRSSHDVDAQLKDFVLHAFAPCKCDTAKKVTPAEVCEGASATYTFTVSSPAGSADLDVDAVDDVFGHVCMPGADGAACTFQTTSCPIALPGGGSKSCTYTVAQAAGTHVDHLTATGKPESGGTLDIVCTASSATHVVNPIPAVTINQLDCNASTVSQGASFTLTATPSGGTPPYGFLWTPGGATGASISSTVVGTYSVGLTDSKSCTASATRKVGYCSN